MKQLILFILLLTSATNFAQGGEKIKERIKAQKVAFITDKLELTSEEAQKFWPIYDKYEQKRRELYRREHRDINDVECISESKADDLLKEFVEIEKEDYELKKQYFADLKSILSSKDIIKLHQLEEDFHRKLIREYRARQHKEREKNNEEK